MTAIERLEQRITELRKKYQRAYQLKLDSKEYKTYNKLNDLAQKCSNIAHENNVTAFKVYYNSDLRKKATGMLDKLYDLENELEVMKRFVCDECNGVESNSWHVQVKPKKMLCTDCFGDTLTGLLSGGPVRRMIAFLKGEK